MPTSDDLRLSAYRYDLPRELIAQRPIEPRDASRLMVVDRFERRIEHRRFRDLLEYLRAGDVLVFNDSRVFPARVYGERAGGGSSIELLLLLRLSPGVWRCLARPGRRLPVGGAFELRGGGASTRGEVLEIGGDGSRVVRLDDERSLDRIGVVPLPPYIREPLEDSERYQTVYAREPGSVAAPTAGLHFTPALLREARRQGLETAFVTLHVGWGTFRPVQEADVTKHSMLAERFHLEAESAGVINRAKREGRRVIAVGTTTARLLEHVASTRARLPDREPLQAASGWADIFIHPGYDFRAVDGLVTNFHLPESTLLMLVSAFADRELILQAYREGVRERYRFYSFGDAMLLL